jgi:nicotinate-nucleotide adenylyltransferase
MPKIALFGTSADPPTKGHKFIINWLSQNFDHVAIWASNNPFKSHIISLEKRSKMLRLMIAEILAPDQNISVYPELSSHRALETVAQAQLLWKNAEFTFVIGSDLVTQLPHWYKIEDFLKQVQLLVIYRPGYPTEEMNLGEIRQLGGNITIAPLIGQNISSTAYREKGDINALTPAIKAYIEQEKLYSWPEEKKMEIRN